ncbi:hypothetical protein MAC_00783 [Metarhizium acridum CQMa 102]|uniref:Uncharacterized protein n=1 Tax=Metarhizium acridum (strain CQMa 102) TaxID=655827 RepID=E9DTE5_METAQ|nr:uncharacterized protein MAC_00783 [Metarhizium acridum CQMa 102]EFY93000.1 hypothetical protein MAC_00783 [Metarhizium acridum CQMa 102]
MDEAMGARILAGIEEGSLEEILKAVRSKITAPSSVKQTHIPALDALAATNLRRTQSRTVSLSGRALPLLYKVISTLVSAPHFYALLVLDLDARFDPTCLETEASNLQHVYVQRPAQSSPEHLRSLVAGAEAFMLYDDATRLSRGRQWWGTVVMGGLAAGDLTAGWKGWARVDRAAVMGFALGTSAEEALAQRATRERAVRDGGWAISSYILIVSAAKQQLRVRHDNNHVPPSVRPDDLVARFPLDLDVFPSRVRLVLGPVERDARRHCGPVRRQPLHHPRRPGADLDTVLPEVQNRGSLLFPVQKSPMRDIRVDVTVHRQDLDLAVPRIREERGGRQLSIVRGGSYKPDSQATRETGEGARA